MGNCYSEVEKANTRYHPFMNLCFRGNSGGIQTQYSRLPGEYASTELDDPKLLEMCIDARADMRKDFFFRQCKKSPNKLPVYICLITRAEDGRLSGTSPEFKCLDKVGVIVDGSFNRTTQQFVDFNIEVECELRRIAAEDECKSDGKEVTEYSCGFKQLDLPVLFPIRPGAPDLSTYLHADYRCAARAHGKFTMASLDSPEHPIESMNTFALLMLLVLVFAIVLRRSISPVQNKF